MLDVLKKYFNKDERQVLSVDQLRLAIGVIGCLFPIILVISSTFTDDCNSILPSLSHYYYSGSRNLFVGLLFAIGMVMFSYIGYEKEDNIAGKSASFLAILIALFPTKLEEYHKTCYSCISSIEEYNSIFSSIHYISAALFFLLLIFFSLRLFTKSNIDPCDWERPKKMRNRIYQICGWIMVVSIIGAGIFTFLEIDTLYDVCESGELPFPTIFFFEFIALEAFGISWLTKAELIFPDKE